MQTEEELAHRLFTGTSKQPSRAPISTETDVELWKKGASEMVNFTPQTPNFVASTTSSVVSIEPPDTTEEWEILSVTLVDQNHVDLLDTVQFNYMNGNETAGVIVQQGTLTVSISNIGNFGLVNATTFPNRATGNLNLQLVKDGLLVKKDPANAPLLRLNVWLKTTATVGNRAVLVTGNVRRRKLV